MIPNPTDVALMVPPPSDPMAVARRFVQARYARKDLSSVDLLVHHRGDFYSWDGTCWPETEERTIRAALYRWLEKAYLDADGEVPFQPTRFKVVNALDALQAVGHLPQSVRPPAWLSGEGIAPASELVAMSNGLLHLPTRRLYEHSPNFFIQHALPFGFDPVAPPPDRWLTFLGELWADDTESIETLAEVMGYILGGGTSHQKLFMLIGPKRSGKGTIGRVLAGLVGTHNTVGPTLASLTGAFGMQSLIGKPLAVVSDARLGNRMDGMVAVERLLSISGEDILSVDRKFKTAWTGQLPTRFVILTNEIPRFTDSSGALASRFVVLVMTKTWYGRENPRLTEELLKEAPGIFNWALEGLDRLHGRGHFKLPTTAEEALKHLEDLSSPVGAFVRERCDVGSACEVTVHDLYEAWKAWCDIEGREKPGSKAVFGRDLRAAVPTVRKVHREEAQRRWYAYVGIQCSRTNTTAYGAVADNRAVRGRTGNASSQALQNEQEPGEQDGVNAGRILSHWPVESCSAQGQMLVDLSSFRGANGNCCSRSRAAALVP